MSELTTAQERERNLAELAAKQREIDALNDKLLGMATRDELQERKIARLEAQAKKAGNTKLETYWAKVVSHRDSYAATQQVKLQRRVARGARMRGLVNGKCA